VRKSNLFYIAIFSGAIFCTTILVLAVMYGQNIAAYTNNGITKIKSLKDKAMHPFAHNPP